MGDYKKRVLHYTWATYDFEIEKFKAAILRYFKSNFHVIYLKLKKNLQEIVFQVKNTG